MKRLAGAMGLLAALTGGVAAWAGPFMSGYWNKGIGCSYGVCRTPPAVPDVIGPWGQPVPMAAPYSSKPPSGAEAARAMLATSLPLDIVQQTGLAQAAGVPHVVGPATLISPPGVPAMPAAYPRGAAATPNTGGIQLVSGPPGAVAAVGALTGGGHGQFPATRTEIRFVGPAGMKISWYGPTPGGQGGFTTNYIEAPGRYNFVQAAIYRLKLSDIPNRPGLELYPTLEVVPANHKTATFLAHAAVPVVFTEEDFEQVAAGNFVVKVIYLPDPRFQDLAAIGVDEVVSSRLEPGVDPIAEACRRGSILAIVRIGNIDLEAPNTPAMDAPSPYQIVPRQPAPGLHGMRPGAPTMPGGMAPMPPGAAMPPRMPPGMPTPPALPTNLMPPQPQPPRPAGPVGQAPTTSDTQQVNYMPAGRPPTPAELAAQDTGAPPPEKKPAQRRGLFSWGSDKTK